MATHDLNPSEARVTRPSIAVALCTRNREKSLLETLESIWRQRRLPDELIVVDDGELPESLRGEIAARCGVLGIQWRYHKSLRPGLTISRNEAADIAESDVLQYLDDDVTCDEGFLEEVARLFEDQAVGGVTANVIEPTFASRSARIYLAGYALAGWWRVRPRVTPPGPRPAILRDPEYARPARWLSGAAMALRRDIVRAHRFDESLADYALGEDREMGYRLAGHCWLVESPRATLIHRRDGERHTNPRRLGSMTAYNYLYILSKTCALRAVDRALIAWSFLVLAAMHVLWGIRPGGRAHFAELRGMVDGLAAWWRQAQSKAKQAPESLETDGGIVTKPMSTVSPRNDMDRPTRVLFVTTTLDPGGAELMLMSLLEHIDRRVVEPSVLCLKDGGKLAPRCREQGIQVFENVLRFKTDAAVLLRIHRILVEHAVDVVVVAHSGGDRMFWSTLAARTLDVPVVVWSHWFPTADDKHFEPMNRALYRWIDAYVALGERHRLALIRHAHVPAGRIQVIPNAIDLSRFESLPSRETMRHKLRLEEHHIAVVLIANMRREKRHDVFIAAAARLARSDPRLRFLIVGDGPDRDAVQAAAAASGLDHETLRLLGPRDDVLDILRGVDISCLCSDIECFSMSMLEAAAAGCAFIGPAVGAMPEFLEHDRTGLAIRPADVASLADAIAGLAENADLRRRLADAALDRVRQSFGIDNMVGAFTCLFASLRTDRASRSHPAGRGISRQSVNRATVESQ